MAALHRTVATLRVSGDDLDPDEITRLLGCQPTRAQRKGEMTERRHGLEPRVSKYGLWRIEATPTEPEDFNAQVAEIFEKVASDVAIWRDLTSRFHVNLFCGWFMQEGNEGVDLSPDTLLMLGNRGITLALDIYGPDNEA